MKNQIEITKPGCPIARSNIRAGANTVIGSSIIIDGEISGDEDLVVQGTVKGKIQLKESLYVEATISGLVVGNIIACER